MWPKRSRRWAWCIPTLSTLRHLWKHEIPFRVSECVCGWRNRCFTATHMCATNKRTTTQNSTRQSHQPVISTIRDSFRKHPISLWAFGGFVCLFFFLVWACRWRTSDERKGNEYEKKKSECRRRTVFARWAYVRCAVYVKLFQRQDDFK